MKSKKQFVRNISLLLVSFAIGHIPMVTSAQENDSERQQEKLTAFAKTFGYVRYFHPSDQASLVDWNSMAVYGARETLNSAADESTGELMQRLFGPLVVDLEFYGGPEKPKPKTTSVGAADVLAWQHIGVGLSDSNRLYRSARTNRSTRVSVPASPFGNILKSVDAKPLRGKKIRFRFQAKVVNGKSRLQGWIRVDRESKQKGLFNNMGDRPIRKKDWDDYEISGIVDDDASRLTFGVMFFGTGSAVVDNIVLEREDGDDWTDIKIKNGNFEEGDDQPDHWTTRGTGYHFELKSDDRADGKSKNVLRFSRGTLKRKGGILPIVPELGEVVDAQIIGDLRLRMPLALPVKTTYTKGDDPKTDSLIDTINSINVNDTEQNVVCLANVVISWNIFQHFYAYFDQVETDWPATLQTSLASAVKATSRPAATRTLQWLVAQLHDGHGRVIDPEAIRELKALPVAFGWAEKQVVITASNHSKVKVGDVVTHIGERAPIELLKEKETLISGSPQWKRYRGLRELSFGKLDELVELKIRKGSEEDSLAQAVTLTFSVRTPPQIAKREKIEIVVKETQGEGPIYYVDLGTVTPDDVTPKIKEFANAKGIIFDMRGYPKGTQFLFQHMTDEHLQSAKWQVPRQIRPDRVDMKEIETMSRWEMPAKKPRFKGKMVFITNGSAISYAESCLAIIANYKLAEIIGSPTAGANGNVNPFGLPGGYRIAWTGMRVMNHDDSQHHVRGVQPTLFMEPTIEGIALGRDELFEKALELLTNQK